MIRTPQQQQQPDPQAEGKARVLALVQCLAQECQVQSDPALVLDQVEDTMVAACPERFRAVLYHDTAADIMSTLAGWLPQAEYSAFVTLIRGDAARLQWLEHFLTLLQSPADDDDPDEDDETEQEAEIEEPAAGEDPQ
jgi:hypothetical protein